MVFYYHSSQAAPLMADVRQNNFSVQFHVQGQPVITGEPKTGQACKIATYKVIKSTVVGWKRLVQCLQEREARSSHLTFPVCSEDSVPRPG